MNAAPETRTRFLCTIGPGLLEPSRLADLAAAGMSLARVNGSHGTLDDVRKMIAFLRTHLPAGIGILLDLPGNKVRTDNIERPIELVPGAEFRLEPENLTFRSLYARVRSGCRISAADGAIQLEVTAVEGHTIVTRVLVGGALANRKGINIRGIHESMPFDFERDMSLLNLAIETRVDFIGLSFVRSSEQVRRIKAELLGTGVKVVAKVETAEAVERLDHILADADMIMIDRGDLEADIGRENVPLTAKRVIARARECRVPVIVASQFLTTMIERPLPVMAEVSDIANAVLDGADFLMLSEETAIGKHPVACVTTLRAIARAVEREQRRKHQVVILAAGASTGFGSLTTNKHKSMLDVGGMTIIQHQLQNLRACGIADEHVTVVTGHNQRQVEAYLRGEGFLGHFVYNPWFATTNMLASLWLTRLPGNLLVLYGDIIFERSILEDVLESDAGAVLAVDRDAELDPEAEKVVVSEGRIVRASKDIDPAAAFGEFLGLARFDAASAQALFHEMDAILREGGQMEFLTAAFERAAARGLVLSPCLTRGRAWNDNDGLADLDRSREKVFPRIQAAQARGVPVARA